MLNQIKDGILQKMVADSWVTDTQMRANKVALVRRYAEGDHDAFMTKEMREALRIKSGREFNANHLDDIIQTMVDRLEVNRIETIGGDDGADEWVENILATNRFDGIQMDLHESVIRDGDGFIMVGWDNETEQITLTYEPIFDGIEGIIPIHQSSNGGLHCAFKLWHETTETYGDTLRLNAYWPDKIVKYIGKNGGGNLQPFTDDSGNYEFDWVDKSGNPLGVPLVQFSNRRRGNFGVSEIENAIPLQDAMNRNIHSMVMTGELSGFPILTVLGMAPPTKVTPGMVLNFQFKNNSSQVVNPTAEQIEWMKSIRIDRLEASDLNGFIDVDNHLESKMYKITGTPNYGDAGSTASGESLKQREIRLLGKINRFQVKAGNGYEDIMNLALRIHEIYGKHTPMIQRFNTVWHDGRIRNDLERAQITALLRDDLPLSERLAANASAFGWSGSKLESVIEAKENEQLQQLNMFSQLGVQPEI